MERQDQTILPRLVGYYEYGKAVDLLGELIRISTVEEIAVYDQIIARHRELDLYTNLSRLVEPEGRSTLSEIAANDAQDFRKQGLNWMTALAKIELASMLASYSDVKSPFTLVNPTLLEKGAFAELLMDGARYHYWSLSKDPIARRILKESRFEPNSETVAYVRRVALARMFLVAAINYRGQGWSEEQQREAKKWLDDLEGYRSQLRSAIVRYLQKPETRVSSTSTTSTRTVEGSRITSRYCNAILAGERAELARGTATVTAQTPGGSGQ